MAGRLEGKVAIVTGAASGIGRATAERFAAEGAMVVMADKAADRLLAAAAEVKAAAGVPPLPVQTDVTDREAVRSLVTTAVTEHGRLDVMHNNAGGTGVSPLHRMAEDRYRRSMALNLDSVFYGSQAALEVMVEQGSGVILNTASVMGVLGDAMVSAYGAAKAGVINLTRCIAVEYGPLGIRANAIVPGAIDTEGNRRGQEMVPPGTVERLIAQLPMRRMGRPEEVAALALFLASDEASYVNGAIVAVDGAQSAKLATPAMSPD